jgi:hypothetical protein
MSKELQPLDDCYCAQLEDNYNEAIKMSDEELDVKLNEYPEAKRMCAALVLLVEQRRLSFAKTGSYLDIDDWECDVWDNIEKSIRTKNPIEIK